MGGQGSGRRRDAERDAAMAELRRQGRTLAEIGGCFGVSRQTVTIALDKLGVPVPPRRIPGRRARRKAGYLPSATCPACGAVVVAGGPQGGARFAPLCLPCLAKSPGTPLPERLKAHRAAAGLTCGGLAAKVGLTASAISHYEQGLREPSPEILARLAAVLGRGLLGGVGRRAGRKRV